MTYYFTRDHEWVSVNSTAEDTTATVGITDYAQAQLGDVVFVEVPPAGQAVEKGREAAVVESVKAASDVYAPVSGEVVEANGDLEGAPETVNAAPEKAGWFARLKVSDPAEVDALMDRDAYEAFLGTL